jgi:hypothetical protein
MTWGKAQGARPVLSWLGVPRRPVRHRAGWFGVAVFVSSLMTVVTSRAHAYPQWQLSTGSVRCSQCHFAPGGGGLVTEYGRDELGGEQSTFGGNGAFLHGMARLPGWLAVGGDFRGAYAAQAVQDPTGTQQAAFPMQADLQVRMAAGDISIYATGGLRGQARSNVALVPDQNYQPISTSRLISREHYLMWRPGALGAYARLGRFYAPFGLRLAEHVLYVRRDLGFNQLEESYNLSFGHVGESGEVHITAFAPDVLRHMGGRTTGIAIYGERRVLDDTGLIGAQGKLEVGDGSARAIGGLVGKSYLSGWKTLFFAEADLVRVMTPGDDSSQFVGAAGAAVLAFRGSMLTLVGERRQTDLRVRDTATNAAALLVGWFPYAHIEFQLMGRVQFPSGGDAAKTLFAQLHYML